MGLRACAPHRRKGMAMRKYMFRGFVVLSMIGLAVAPAAATSAKNPEHHVVSGMAHTDFNDEFAVGSVTRNFGVVSVGDVAMGHINEHLVEAHPEGWYVADTRFRIKVDCLEVDTSTGEAWMGGVIVSVKGGVTFDDGFFEVFPPLDTNVVYYIDDNRGTGTPDIQGGVFTGEDWGEPDYTCHDRPAPWVPDPLMRGDVHVK